ncbi:hypothetical protein HA051_08195 [Chromobacterium vaccinii]|nr:hypothetical protein [Chromobacterium vaccinii]
MDWCDKKAIELKDWMLKRAQKVKNDLIMEKGSALFISIQLILGMIIPYYIGQYLKTAITDENAGNLAIGNLTIYLVIFFIILYSIAETEKTRPRLLFSGLAMIMLGIFTADGMARFMAIAQEKHIGNYDENLLFSDLLKNTYLYLSAAIGGGIVSSSILQPVRIENDKPKQCQCSVSATKPPEKTTK